jgi:AcrR family transcriptional regulator
MARWEPNALARLHTAAVELFAERGYDSTTAAEIAERAGLAKSTFFRHFADKREALFFGQDLINEGLAAAIAAAPASSSPLSAVGAALEALAAAFPPSRREGARQRQAIIDAHDELRERELLKRAAMTAAMAEALRKREVPSTTAALAAQIGDLALSIAYARWLGSSRPFASVARQSLDELREAAAGLD